MQKFEFLRQPLLWFWIAVVRTRKEKDWQFIIFVMKIVATFVSASSQGQRTHSARTNYSELKYISPKQNIHFLHYDYVSMLLFVYQPVILFTEFFSWILAPSLVWILQRQRHKGLVYGFVDNILHPSPYIRLNQEKPSQLGTHTNYYQT